MIFPAQLVRPLVTASAVVAGTVFVACLDCSPDLYLYDKLLYRPRQFLDQKTVWIVGASSGIGRELARQLAEGGCNRIILSGRSTEALENVARECQELSTCSEELVCHCWTLDVTDDNDWKRMFDEEIPRLAGSQSTPQMNDPGIDMIFLNAGAGHLSPALETSSTVSRRVFDVNTLWVIDRIPQLCSAWEANPPHMVVTSSIAAVLPVALSSSYAASKAALSHYCRSLLVERSDLKLDIVCPGPVETNFHRNHLDQNGVQPTTTSSSVTAADAPAADPPPKSRLKMAVQRCVRLILAAAAMPGNQEAWIADQPVLTSLYLFNWLPRPWTSFLLGRLGAKRVQLWREGCDLYDPSSWTK